MCLISFSWNPDHPRRLVLVANRDEFYRRPTAQMTFWHENASLLAGKDLLHLGTWMGVTTHGRFAAITNYRGRETRTRLRSRGHLPQQYLEGTESPMAFARQLTATADQYGGFNLLLGDNDTLVYYSNKSAQPPVCLPAGLYGLSNHLLDTPWPKVVKAKWQLASLLRDTPHPQTETLLTLLQDKRIALDHELPDTGVGREFERLLSAQFIHSPIYGTRATTALIVDKKTGIQVAEQSFTYQGPLEPAVTFHLNPGQNATG